MDAFLEDLFALFRGTKAAHLGRHLYDGEGSNLWKALAERVPSYRVADSLAEAVRLRLPELALRLPKGLTMVDLGPGGDKSVAASARIAAAFGVRAYWVIDSCLDFCRTATEIARPQLPGIDIEYSVADFFEQRAAVFNAPSIAYLGGGTIGNLVHPVSDIFPAELLTRVLQHLVASFAPAGWLLLAFDTTRDRGELDSRYGSETNRKFILNIMQRAAENFPGLGLNRNLFAYTPQYVERSGQYAHIVTATAEQHCGFGRISAGQPFHIINSYKFAPTVFESAIHAISCAVEYRALEAESGAAVYLIRSSNAKPFSRVG